jgi:hypothetical protein
MTQPLSWQDHRKALDEDWSQFTAIAPIYYDGALAYRVGDAVPATNVKLHNYEAMGLVKKSSTKAAAVARGDETK